MLKTTAALERGQKIKSAREAARMSQTTLADFAGVTRAAVSQWEAGQVQDIVTANAASISVALGIPMKKLVSDKIWQQIEDSAALFDIEGAQSGCGLSPEALRIGKIWDRLPNDSPMKTVLMLAAEQLIEEIACRCKPDGKESQAAK